MAQLRILPFEICDIFNLGSKIYKQTNFSS